MENKEWKEWMFCHVERPQTKFQKQAQVKTDQPCEKINRSNQ